MAKITYQVVQKPIEQRIIDAACIYWDVDKKYFTEGNPDRNATYRKAVLCYLIKHNTTYSTRFIADLFGRRSHAPVLRLIDNLTATKEKIRQHSEDINNILLMSDQLDADFMQVDVQLVNNKIEIT